MKIFILLFLSLLRSKRMTIQKLKELLNQYPDESRVIIFDGKCEFDEREITSVLIEYIEGDDYKVPEIILK